MQTGQIKKDFLQKRYIVSHIRRMTSTTYYEVFERYNLLPIIIYYQFITNYNNAWMIRVMSEIH